MTSLPRSISTSYRTFPQWHPPIRCSISLRNRCCFLEFNGEELADAVAPHRDAVEDAGTPHRLAIVRDDEKLALLRERLYHIAVAARVRLIKRGVGFVE